jgi:hypothetical protein
MKLAGAAGPALLLFACGGKLTDSALHDVVVPDDAAVRDACGACADAAPGADVAPIDGAMQMDPTEISPSGLSYIEAETDLAVSGSLVAVVWIGISGLGAPSHIGYRFSRDGGVTWDPVRKVDAPGARQASDPVVVTTTSGDFYLAFVGFHLGAGNVPTDTQMYVAKAPSGASEFAAPVVVSDPNDTSLLDKPWITVTEAGTIMVTYASLPSAGTSASILASRSTNGGVTWTHSQVATGPDRRNLAMPCPGGGAVYVVYLGDGGVTLKRSDDDGATFPDAHTTTVATGLQLTFDDPSCAVALGDVWVAWEESPPSSVAANVVKVARSADRGATFGVPSRASDHPLAYHAELAREASGALDLVYYAGKSDPDTTGAYRRTRSVGGSTWTPSVVVMKDLTFLTDRQGVKWLGDYAGIAPHAGLLYTSFTENKSGLAHVAFARFPP